MQPILWQWGQFILPAWHCLYVIAALAAYQLLFFLRRRYYPELPAHKLTWLYVGAYIGGYLGARLLSIMIDQPEVKGWSASALELVTLGPMTFYGGFAGACLASITYGLAAGLDLRKVADLCLPAGFLGLAIGRIGCFLNGDDYGLALSVPAGEAVPWWVVATPADEAGGIIWRVPVQLWECVGALLIVVLAVCFLERTKKQPQPLAAGLLTVQLYCVLRFSDEFLRADPRGVVLGGALSPAQLISLLLLLGAGILLVRVRSRDLQLGLGQQGCGGGERLSADAQKTPSPIEQQP